VAASEVLDLGVGNGSLGRYLTSQRQCQVDGADFSEESVQQAAADYRELRQLDLDQPDALQVFSHRQYDFVVLADVLEHLREPQQLLRQAAGLLAPGGQLLLSIPNVAYAGVVLELLEGRFDYRNQGILDTTHLRFYTLSSMRDLVEGAGLYVSSLQAVRVPLHRSEFDLAVPERLPAALRKALADRSDSLAYQYIIGARLDQAEALVPDPGVDFDAVQGTFEARLLWMSRSDLHHSEAKQQLQLLRLGDEHCPVEFEISDAENLEILRYSPADRSGSLRINMLQLEDVSSGRQIDLLDPAIWSFTDNLSQGLLMTRQAGALCLQLTDSHAWFEIPLDRLAGWHACRQLRLRVQQSWPLSQDYCPPDQGLRGAMEQNLTLGNQLAEERAHRRGLMGEVMSLGQQVQDLEGELRHLQRSRLLRLGHLSKALLLRVRDVQAFIWLGRKKLETAAITDGSQDSAFGSITTEGASGQLLFPVPTAFRGRVVYFEIGVKADSALQGTSLFSVIDDQLEELNAPIYVNRKTGALFGTLLLSGNLQGLAFSPSRLPCTFELKYFRVSHIPGWVRILFASNWHWLWFYRTFGAEWVLERWREEISLFFERFPRLGKQREYRHWWASYGAADADMLQAQRSRPLNEGPQISVILPVYDTPLELLRKTIDSVLAQTYGNWQLCIADDASPEVSLRLLLDRYCAQDSRIRVFYREQNGHISANTNSALALAEGEYVCFLDHDDELAPNALYEIVAALQANPEVRVLYTDEDIIDEEQHHIRPHFKPDWNPDYLMSVNYFCHLLVAERSLVEEVGGLREGFEGAQDYDLILRLTRAVSSEAIFHLPRVLYHWRAIEGSTADSMDSKDYALEAGRRALQEHLCATGTDALVELSELGTAYRVRYPVPEVPPRVAIIIPSRNGADLLGHCVNSIFLRTNYPNYEITIVDNQSDDPAALDLLQRLDARENVQVIPYDHPFNFSAIMNHAVLSVDADIVLLMNNDTEIINEDWLGEMVSHAVRDGIGAVGAKLLFPSGYLQHAGVVLGLGPDAVAGHAFKGLHKHDIGHMGRSRLIQNYSAVTGACLAVRRELYLEMGGLDEDNLAIAFNDVDFCLKLLAAGYRNVWTPYAQLYHFESVSRGYDVSAEKRARFEREGDFMREKWGTLLDDDPCYNPNLTQHYENFDVAWPPRRRS
jgi:methionine biosynthesis protein MetW